MYTEYDYLAHHGVKGMKWGVRKAVARTTSSAKRLGYNVRNKGVFRGTYQWHAQNVSRRLNEFDKARMAKMNKRQRTSYERAKKYWDAKAAGKTNAEIKKDKNVQYRGIFRRNYDSFRSRSAKVRVGAPMAYNLLASHNAAKTMRDLGVDARVGVGKTAAMTIVSSLFDEGMSKVIGHY